MNLLLQKRSPFQMVRVESTRSTMFSLFKCNANDLYINFQPGCIRNRL